MKFMLLILDDEKAQSTLPPGTMEKIVAGHGAFAGALAQAGKLVDGKRLRGPETGKRIRLKGDGGARAVTDGPFPETKEVLGGYYVIECADLAEALEWAKKVPISRFDAVELRPVWDD